MENILTLVSAHDFREQIVECTTDNLLLEGYVHIDDFNDIIENLDDEIVEKELVWSLCNATESVIHTYLASKNLVDIDEWKAEVSFHSGSVSEDCLCGDVTVEYGENGLEGITKANIFTAGFSLSFNDFLNNDEAVHSAILEIASDVEKQIEYDEAPPVELNTITVYSLRECCFIVVSTDLSDEQVTEEMKKYRDENPNSDVADFSFDMGQRKNILWNEIGDTAIDFENLED